VSTPRADPAAEPSWAGVPGWIGVLGRLRDVARQEVLASQLASPPEREAGGRDPHRSVAALLHLIYVRGRAS
jgi:hypothetical protein